MKNLYNFSNYIESFSKSALSCFSELSPWDLTNNSNQYVLKLMRSLLREEFSINEEIAIHKTAIIETGAMLKGPMIIGPRCFISSSALLRGGVWLDADCIIGPGSELKSTFIFSGSKLAHLNFVGDSVLGNDVNLEAGSIIANYRNELDNKEIQIFKANQLIKTGVNKFGALVGDECKIGANAVIAPGALLMPKTIVRRLELVDQKP